MGVNVFYEDKIYMNFYAKLAVNMCDLLKEVVFSN